MNQYVHGSLRDSPTPTATGPLTWQQQEQQQQQPAGGYMADAGTQPMQQCVCVIT
jgi:hypothetical protein